MEKERLNEPLLGNNSGNVEGGEIIFHNISVCAPIEEAEKINLLKASEEAELENQNKKSLRVQIVVGKYGWDYSPEANTPVTVIPTYEKHVLLICSGTLMLVNLLTLCIFYKHPYPIEKYLKLPFFISYFLFVLTMMLSVLLLVYSDKYVKYTNPKWQFFAFAFVFLFYVCAGIKMAISERTQLDIGQIYAVRLFFILVLLILTYAFEISTLKSVVFSLVFSLAESYFYVEKSDNYYKFTTRTVVYMLANVAFIMLVDVYNIVKDKQVAKHRLLFVMFTLSLVANGGILSFIYDLSLLLMIGQVK